MKQLCVLVYFYHLAGSLCFAFLQPVNVEQFRQEHGQVEARTSLKARGLAARSANQAEDGEEFNVVLFGIGDLRTDDHEGLNMALASTRRTAAVCILDKETLRNIPGIFSHTFDTVNVLSKALHSLSQSLAEKHGITLRVALPEKDTFTEVLKNLVGEEENSFVYAHDLGPADNQIGYGSYSRLEEEGWPEKRMKTWTSNLRKNPWEDVGSLPTTYTDYRKRFASEKPIFPRTHPIQDCYEEEIFDLAGPGLRTVESLSTDILVDHTVSVLDLDLGQVEAEKDTGIYLSHWGGLCASTAGCAESLDIIEAYLGDAKSKDQIWIEHPLYPGRSGRRNSLSLEHASMEWQLKGKGESGTSDMKQWMQGEVIIRWAAAPLLFGTLSPIRLWHAADKFEGPQLFFENPIKTLVEGREWHRLLAARNMQVDEMYHADGESKTRYTYWRYQGFLCRYAKTKMDDIESSMKTGILLVHAFGASGAQWNKVMQSLGSPQSSNQVLGEGLALDLLGFGESEKPAVSYTAYLWDSMVCDFMKERALAKYDWESIVLGGK